MRNGTTRSPLSTIMVWLKGEGVNKKRFKAAFDSLTVSALVARSQWVHNYRVHNVCRLAVAGRYRVTGQAALNLADLLASVDDLIDMASRTGSAGR